jgi:hypothetical protein
VVNRDEAWIAVRRRSPVPVFVRPCASPGGLTTICLFIDDKGLLADLERGPAGLDDENFDIGMPMELRPDAGFGVNEDDREGHLAVLVADELVGLPAVLEIVERHDRAGRAIGVRQR